MSSVPATRIESVTPTVGRDSKMVLSRLWLYLSATRSAVARGQAPVVLRTARLLLSALGSGRVHAELAHTAEAFAHGLEERSDAEEWALFAVAARATLENALQSGAQALGRELDVLDDAFEEVREAVLVLEPEDYKEALGVTSPRMRAWWGERARLDAGFREIELERALGDLAER